MKRLAIAAAAAALALAAQARVMPISEGRLYTDLDAAGHSITNLPDGFFPTNGFLRTHQSLAPATNYTDAALGAFAGTGTVERARSYGTPTRWTDANGCVWEVMLNVWVDHAEGNVFRGGTSIFPSEREGDMRGYLYYDPAAMEYVGGTGGGWYYNGRSSAESPWDVFAGGPDATSLDNGRFTFGNFTNLVSRVALTNDIPDVSGYTTQQQATNAATAVADTKISTNNAAFVSAVLAVPLVGVDAGDLAEIAEYGSYGTVGAAILALIAGLAALKRRMATAETALAQKADVSDLPYRLVTPGEWEFSDGGTHFVSGPDVDSFGDAYVYWLDDDTRLPSQGFSTQSDALSALSLTFDNFGTTVTATRASLPGHLCDRAGNRVEVSGDTTLTLPAANPGYLRDFLVRLEISGSTVPTITFATPTGETITYETDGDDFPVPDEAGTCLYSFTETAASTFAVALKKVNTVAQGGA